MSRDGHIPGQRVVGGREMDRKLKALAAESRGESGNGGGGCLLALMCLPLMAVVGTARRLGAHTAAQRALDTTTGITLTQLRSELHNLWLREGGGNTPDVTELGQLAADADNALEVLTSRLQYVDCPQDDREARLQTEKDQLAGQVTAARDYLESVVTGHERRDHAEHLHCDAHAVATEALGRLLPLTTRDAWPAEFTGHRTYTPQPVAELAAICRRYAERAAAAGNDADRRIRQAVGDTKKAPAADRGQSPTKPRQEQ